MDIEFRAIGPPLPPIPKPPRKVKKRRGRKIGSKNKTDIRRTEEWKRGYRERRLQRLARLMDESVMRTKNT